MNKRAVILAGGKGTRLRPYTISIPKPLVPLGDKPILEVLILKLKANGFNHITISVNYMAEMIKAYFGNGERLGVKIDYSLETIELSTIGPLTLIKDLPNDFLLINGDVLTDLDFNKFYLNHKENNNIFTISAHKRLEKIDYGVLKSNNDILVGFEEKPTYDFLVSMGVYMLNKKVLDFIPKNKYFGFDHLMLSMISLNINPKIHEHTGYWLDIGRPSDYEKALLDVSNNLI
jgi:NDP-sugar pyrophosphorylase family protein